MAAAPLNTSTSLVVRSKVFKVVPPSVVAPGAVGQVGEAGTAGCRSAGGIAPGWLSRCHHVQDPDAPLICFWVKLRVAR